SSQERKEILGEKFLLNITRLCFAVAIFGLNARLRREFMLEEEIRNAICLVGVLPKPIGRKVVSTSTKSGALVDTRQDTFSAVRVIFAHETACLIGKAVTVEKRIKFVE